MKKNKQYQEATDIIVGENAVASLTFVVYETGGLDVQFNINDPQNFHATDDSRNDLNDLISSALESSKEKLSGYVTPKD